SAPAAAPGSSSASRLGSPRRSRRCKAPFGTGASASPAPAPPATASAPSAPPMPPGSAAPAPLASPPGPPPCSPGCPRSARTECWSPSPLWIILIQIAASPSGQCSPRLGPSRPGRRSLGSLPRAAWSCRIGGIHGRGSPPYL
ncbi:MAG: hypothetical protein AVDCRST_MAG27-4727, partial [uncultured Craurococcus sp.]